MEADKMKVKFFQKKKTNLNKLVDDINNWLKYPTPDKIGKIEFATQSQNQDRDGKINVIVGIWYKEPKS